MSKHSSRKPTPVATWARPLLAFLAFAVSAGLMILYRPPIARPAAVPVAHITATSGRDLVQSGDLRAIATQGLGLVTGDRIRADQAPGADIQWVGGCRMTVEGELEILSGESRAGAIDIARLHQGRCRTDNPDRSLPGRLITPLATISQSGMVSVEITPAGTRIEVTSGHAIIRAESGAEDLLVAAGEHATISPWGALQLGPPAPPPTPVPTPEATPAPSPSEPTPTPDPTPAPPPESGESPVPTPTPTPMPEAPPAPAPPAIAASSPVIGFTVPDQRLASEWPFSADSAWNTPLGSKMRMEPMVSPFLEKSTDALSILTQPIVVHTVRKSDPVRRIRNSGGGASVRWPITSGLDLAGTESRPVVMIHHDGTSALEVHGLRADAEDKFTADAMEKVDLKGTGIGPETKGLGEWGGPAIAGLIRNNEWRDGIPHALAVLLPPEALNRRTSSGRAFVWPASAAHPQWRTAYGTEGNLHLGSLLVLPPDLDLATLRLTPGGQAWRIAEALQNYGAYIVGTTRPLPEGFDGIVFLTAGSPNQVNRDPLAGMRRVWARVQVVSGNNARQPGGGGTPRRPGAPPFHPVAQSGS